MRRRFSRRWFLAGSVGLLAAWLPVPVMFHVVNASGEDAQVRIAGTEPWIEAPAGVEVYIGEYGYAGLCNPPDQWLPETFTGIEFKLAGGSVVQISRDAFAAEAEYKRGWTYRFRG